MDIWLVWFDASMRGVRKMLHSVLEVALWELVVSTRAWNSFLFSGVSYRCLNFLSSSLVRSLSFRIRAARVSGTPNAIAKANFSVDHECYHPYAQAMIDGIIDQPSKCLTVGFMILG